MHLTNLHFELLNSKTWFYTEVLKTVQGQLIEIGRGSTWKKPLALIWQKKMWKYTSTMSERVVFYHLENRYQHYSTGGDCKVNATNSVRDRANMNRELKKKTDSEIWDIFNNSESITLQSLWKIGDFKLMHYF